MFRESADSVCRQRLQTLPCVRLCLAGIQQLQLILLKVALIVAVEFHINVEFVSLLEPPEDQGNAGKVLPRALCARQSNEPADDPQAVGRAIGVKEQGEADKIKRGEA